MDGRDWKTVDERSNNADLNARNVSRFFEIPAELHQDCCFVRLRQTGKNHNELDVLYFAAFEVFGDFAE
jgi:hypothetical protein